jgi:hypothetical protein
MKSINQLFLILSFIFITTINSQNIIDPVINYPFKIVKLYNQITLPDSLGGKLIYGKCVVQLIVNEHKKVIETNITTLKLWNKKDSTVVMNYLYTKINDKDILEKYKRPIFKYVSKLKIKRTLGVKPEKLNRLDIPIDIK